MPIFCRFHWKASHWHWTSSISHRSSHCSMNSIASSLTMVGVCICPKMPGCPKRCFETVTRSGKNSSPSGNPRGKRPNFNRCNPEEARGNSGGRGKEEYTDGSPGRRVPGCSAADQQHGHFGSRQARAGRDSRLGKGVAAPGFLSPDSRRHGTRTDWS